MAARAAITINDSVPVARTFNPTQDSQKGVSFFFDRSSGVAAGFGQIQIQLVEPPMVSLKTSKDKLAQRLYKATVRLNLPTLETVSNNSAGYTPAPSMAYYCAAKVEFFIPERATLTNRKDLLALTKNLLAQSVVTALVETLEGVY